MARQYFYEGADSSLEPGKEGIYSGKVRAGLIGGTTSIQTANQIQEVSNLFNSGMKVAEVSTINPEVFDMIPKQQLKEINRLTKLTGTDVTLHAPMIEPSGFTQQGWSEQNREEAERQFKEVVFRASELSPDKPIPITIHSSAIPGTERMPVSAMKKELLTEEEKKLGSVQTQMIAVNQNTGELVPLRREIRHYPEAPEGKLYVPEKEIEIANRSYWDNKLSQLVFYKERGDALLAENYPQIKLFEQQVVNGELTKEQFKNELKSNQVLAAAANNVKNAEIYLKNTHQSVSSLFNEAYKAADNDGKTALIEASKGFKKDLTDFGKTNDVGKYSAALQGVLNAMQEITTSDDGPTPRIYKPIEEFALDKASETFSNVAVEAYKKFEGKAPIISIENPPYGTALSTGEDLKKLIDESRRKFAEKLSRDKGMSLKEAERAAEQIIGATWDTSHISMMRKQGFGKEELVKQAEIIAPYVKHVHMNDNLGYTHTDLPPGMGDVPFNEILPLLKEKGSKDKKFIFEGGNFFQHFKTSPHSAVLEGVDSPIYAAVNQPTWKSYGTSGVYSSGYGPFLPEQHFSVYGSGFSGLPQELGGQISGKQSRFSGTPNV